MAALMVVENFVTAHSGSIPQVWIVATCLSFRLYIMSSKNNLLHNVKLIASSSRRR